MPGAAGVEHDLTASSVRPVMVPPVSVQVYVEPGLSGTLAEAPDAPTGSESGAVMTGSVGRGRLTVIVTVGLLVDAQPFAAVTVSV